MKFKTQNSKLKTLFRLPASGFCLILALAFLAGCQQTEGPSVFTETHTLPKEFVGTWISEGFPWVFVFDEKGDISSMVHGIGAPIETSQGGVEEEAETGEKAVFILDKCDSYYNEKTRLLSIRIPMSYFQMELPYGKGLLEGESEDYFFGEVAMDGKTWNADWLSYSQIKGSSPPDPDVVYAIEVVFKKAETDNKND